MVPMAGLEPATHEFSVHCSTIGATSAYKDEIFFHPNFLAQ